MSVGCAETHAPRNIMVRENENYIHSLIDSALGGDKTAFNQLWARFEHYVGRIVYCVLNDKNKFDDAKQETALRLYQSLPTFDKSRNFKSWLRIIATREALKINKGEHAEKRRAPTLSLSDLTPGGHIKQEIGRGGSFEPAETVNFLRELVDRYDYLKLLEAIEFLVPTQREAIELTLNGYNQSEIAEMLGLSHDAVYMRLKGAIPRLQELINQPKKKKQTIQ